RIRDRHSRSLRIDRAPPTTDFWFQRPTGESSPAPFEAAQVCCSDLREDAVPPFYFLSTHMVRKPRILFHTAEFPGRVDWQARLSRSGISLKVQWSAENPAAWQR